MLVLKPGEFHFGSTGERIKTLLGSCIAITFWAPSERMGGMCHYLLPENPNRTNKTPDGRYADQLMELVLAELKRTGTRREGYQVKIFGGGNMFPNLSRNNTNDVGRRNINAARQLLKANHFKIHSEHVGQTGHRTVILDLHTGYTWLRWQRD